MNAVHPGNAATAEYLPFDLSNRVHLSSSRIRRSLHLHSEARLTLTRDEAKKEAAEEERKTVDVF